VPLTTINHRLTSPRRVDELLEAAILEIQSESNAINSGDIVFVSSLEQLPVPILGGGVIYLLEGVTYYFTRHVDLLGARLVGGINTAILGTSSENSRIKSTGLSASTALISSGYSLPIQHITLEAGKIFDLDASLNANQALDWYGVNLQGSTNIGTIKGYTNFVVASMAFLGVSGLVFDGTIGTIAFSDTIFQGSGSGTIITIPSTANIARRFRINLSSMIVPSGTGINFSTSATVPVEGYILDTVNFSGGGTYTTGVPYTDNKSRWKECRGIKNSSTVSNYTMHGNAIATIIPAINTRVKVAGVTVNNPITQGFDNSISNRSVYTRKLEGDYKVTAIFSLSGTANHKIGVYVALNGVVIESSKTYITANAAGRVENGAIHAVVELAETNYIEIFTEDTTTTAGNITFEDLNVIIEHYG
jgi:uncharacterized membrane protein